MAGIDMKLVAQIAGILVIIGAINWGLEAINMNAVQGLVGQAGSSKKKTALERIVYILVGLAGLVVAYEKLGGKME
jgi:uncharacterized membrane protein YuzA (DUF378 family)